MNDEAYSPDNTLLRRSIEDLTNQVNKMIGINMSLQSKMVELLIKITDLIEETKEMTTLLKMASGGGEKEETKPGIDVELIGKMLEQNQKLLERIATIENQVKKVYRHQVLEKIKEKNQVQKR
ncbi:MAG: hypothetical protein PHW96_03625 [Candidatus Nanoarchaeia archaeon]|nr:hypothetical protein [Candidatus Nanoarchaeia archaeon]